MKGLSNKVYLGDGVYAQVSNGGYVYLTSENGTEVLDEVFIEVENYRSLKQFVKQHFPEWEEDPKGSGAV